MKRLASAVAVSAVLVLAPVGLAGTASAQTFSSCREAAAVGVFNIPLGAPGYRPALDRDKDGIACERDGSDGAVGTVQDEPASSSGSSRPDQVTVVPEGGAETGDGSTDTTSPAWWLAGGVLAAAAGLVGARRVRTRA